MTTKEGEIYLCDYCGAEFMTRSGAAKHEKKCAHRTTEEKVEKDDEPAVELYEAPKAKPKPATVPTPVSEDEDEYCCPSCDYVSRGPFQKCPRCGEELTWTTETREE